MKNQFERVVIATCAGCVTDEIVYYRKTIRDAKVALENEYGWKKTKEGWICSECAEKED